MSRPPIIPPQSQHGTAAQSFHSFAKRLLAVPKSEIDAQEKKEGKPKNRKGG